MPNVDPEFLFLCFFGMLGLLMLAVAANRRFGRPPAPPSICARADASGLPPELREKLVAKLRAGRKIEAIKELREAQGWDLKRSKEAVEALEFERRATSN